MQIRAKTCKFHASFSRGQAFSSLLVLANPVTGAQNTIGGCNKAGASGILRGCRTRSSLAGCLQALTPPETLEQQQLARQLQATEQAKQARDTQQRRLREMGLESRLDYGQKLFSVRAKRRAKPS